MNIAPKPIAIIRSGPVSRQSVGYNYLSGNAIINSGRPSKPTFGTPSSPTNVGQPLPVTGRGFLGQLGHTLFS